MKKALLLSSLAALLLFLYPLSYASVLGQAADYNAFIFGNMNVWNSDSEGRIAAGGDMDVDFYGVGRNASPGDYSIVGGGYVDFYSGSVQNGGIFADDDITLEDHTINGNVTANGSVTINSSGTINGTVTSNAGAESPVDFTDSYNYLSWLSGAFASTAANGTTEVTDWYAITLSGTDDVNYFNLSGDALSNAVSIDFDISPGDVAIVNVSGSINSMSNFGFLDSDDTSPEPLNILYNFYESDELTLQNIGVMGSILAPDSDVTFNDGNINGTLIAGSMSGKGEFHQYQFEHDVPVVPEPVSSTLFIIGGAAFGIRRFISFSSV